MENHIAFFEDYILRKTFGLKRFTQDSPVFPEVWAQYFLAKKNDRVDLILTPHRKYSSATLLVSIRQALKDFNPTANFVTAPPFWHLATSGEMLAVKLTFEELVHVALPMTSWWQNYLWDKSNKKASDQHGWFSDLVKAISWFQLQQGPDFDLIQTQQGLLSEEYKNQPITPALQEIKPQEAPTPLWAVSWNRRARISMYRSNRTIKAEPSRRLFDIDGRGITWAVIDSGIDATHPGFRAFDPVKEQAYQAPFEPNDRQPNKTRIVATYDFTKLRKILTNLEGAILAENVKTKNRFKKIIKTSDLTQTSDNQNNKLSGNEIRTSINDIEKSLKNGRDLDWSVIAPLIRIPHRDINQYEPPKHPHGTHVAGILGANMALTEGKRSGTIVGVCPAIEIYDLRVFEEDGTGDEFSILAALQFVRWLNRQKDQPIIHGVNMSMSLKHEVRNYACGRTPICEECNRLVGQGAIVVAAAGNAGRSLFTLESGFKDEGYRDVSITDPGNAEQVITVGSTHRNKPHSYGVSYFSSRGPTGDGRLKPDLVAPGEKIVSLYPDEMEERLDGTSMAAPHVSGAAALLLAKNRELIGEPGKVKHILCSTATDLNREKYFQGAGLVDVLRALQSI